MKSLFIILGIFPSKLAHVQCSFSTITKENEELDSFCMKIRAQIKHPNFGAPISSCKIQAAVIVVVVVVAVVVNSRCCCSSSSSSSSFCSNKQT
jgi:hypothetical protein